MPLFKKFIYFIMIICILLLVAYLLIYTYVKNEGYEYNVIKDYSKVLNIGFKDLYHSFVIQFVESFADTIVCVVTFRYKNMGNNEKNFLIIIGISSIPFLLTFFQFITYRGFQAFKLKIKKAKANPFYYHDYVIQNKEYGSDNVEETDVTLLPLLIPLRILVLVVILLLMPVVLLAYLIIELVGLFRGITNTGKALDFE